MERGRWKFASRESPVPIWSQDKDMECAGVTVYTTGELVDAIRLAGDESV